MDIQGLLNWYNKEKRDLPFRHEKNPYHIWVSEIMSQQTRIEAMIPYYNRFVARYKTITALANAQDEELTKLWQGLGYYARVRNMKKAANVCVEQYEGQLPKTKQELKKLPGIGDYTAGAIASIAYNECCTAIDGNVIRVASRYYWLEQDFNNPKNKRELDAFLQTKLPEEQYMSDFTQAMMELGARVCTPKVARCSSCPIRSSCIGATKENPCVLPVAKKKLEQKIEEKIVCIVAGWKDGQWWIHLNQRAHQGLLAGMYEFDESFPSFLHKQKTDSHGLICDRNTMDDQTVFQRFDLDQDEFVFTHKIWKMKAELVLYPVGDGFSSIEEIKNEKAIPTAYEKLYQRALALLQKMEQDGQMGAIEEYLSKLSSINRKG